MKEVAAYLRNGGSPNHPSRIKTKELGKKNAIMNGT